jgi:hypothetical protein
MPTDKQIADRIKTLVPHRPNAIGNSIVMAILQFASYILGWSGIILSSVILYRLSYTKEEVYILKNNLPLRILPHHFYFNQTAGICSLACGVLLLLVWRLTKMVRRRNAFILEVALTTEEEEPVPSSPHTTKSAS